MRALINKPLATISKNCFNERIFPNEKNDNQIVTNYRPVSLVPVCSKIFEQIIYNPMYKYISHNNLLSLDQSVFCTGIHA